MRRPNRQFSIFTMSALDILATSTGVFVLFLVILMPYYQKEFDLKADIAGVLSATEEKFSESSGATGSIDSDREAAAAAAAVTGPLEAVAEALRREIAELAEALAKPDPEPVYVPPPAPPKEATESRRTIEELDLVFVIDRTRSMAPTIAELAVSIRAIVRILERLVPSLRIGIVGYSDRDTGLPPIRALALTRTNEGLARIVGFISRIQPARRGSRTIEEDVFLGVKRAVFMNFRPGARQIIIVIGDAPAHPNEVRATIDQVARFARTDETRTISSLSVTTPSSVRTGNAHEPFFAALAAAGGGVHHVHSGQMVESVLLSVLVE